MAVYREGEADRLLQTVRGAYESRDSEKLVAAVVELWQQSDDEATRDGVDAWALEAWRYVVGADLITEVVRAGIGLLEQGKELRLNAVVHIAHHAYGAFKSVSRDEYRRTVPRTIEAGEGQKLLDLLGAIRTAEYRDKGYSAAILLQFFERKAKRLAFPYLRAHSAYLQESLENWLMVACLLAASDLHSDETTAWLWTWPQRSDAPMWAAALYLCAVRPAPEQLEEWSGYALQSLHADASARLVCCMYLESLLRQGRDQEFREALSAYSHILGDPWADPPAQPFEPIAGFLNGFRDQYMPAGDSSDNLSTAIAVGVAFGPAAALLASGSPTFSHNVHGLFGQLVQYDRAAPQAVALFSELMDADSKDEVLALRARFGQLKAPWIGHLRMLWKTKSGSKLPFFARVFGGR